MNYDLIIIGGGPAGLTAGLYASRAKLKTLLLEKALPGGAIVTTDLVENYPGFPEGINGFELGLYMRQQAERFGLEIISDEIVTTHLEGEVKRVVTAEKEYFARAVIIATGAKPSKLKIPGEEEEFTGRGVSYCGTCDGAFS
ncbi:MAG TPA: FAD-dependent oxidoreductase, partial [Bacillota bacterium]|nr:FAD-dependent oxidoreductase [Bacillota bacterium]